MKFADVLKEINKLRDAFPTGFVDYKIVQRDGDIKFIECNLKFMVEDGQLIPCNEE